MRPSAQLDLPQAAKLSPAETLTRLDARDAGLTGAEASARLLEYGPNVLRTHGVHALDVLVRQLRSYLLLLLLAAAVVSAVVGDVNEALIIAAIMTMSIGLSFVNEFRSEKAVEALHSQIRHHAAVDRDGASVRVDVSSLVPGDVVHVRVGDVVPADLRLLESHGLECDESVLTGEAEAARKTTVVGAPGESPLDLATCAFMGTIVRSGAGRGVVVATGAHTAFGGIALSLGATPRTDRVPARPAGLLAHDRDRGRRAGGIDLRDQRSARAIGAPIRPVRPGNCGRPHAAAAARDRDRESRCRQPPARSEGRDRQAARLYRGSRQHPGALHRQDRHAHRRRDPLRRRARARRQQVQHVCSTSGWHAAIERATSSTRHCGMRRRPTRLGTSSGKRSIGCRSITNARSPRCWRARAMNCGSSPREHPNAC